MNPSLLANLVINRSNTSAFGWTPDMVAYFDFLKLALRSARACEAADRIAWQNAEPQAPTGFAPYPRLP